jgi:hypothetical protein
VKKAGRALKETLEFWFRKKYNLAPTDPRFLDCTPEQIQTEFWAHQYDTGKVTEEFEDYEFDAQAEFRRINEEAEAAERSASADAGKTPIAPPVSNPPVASKTKADDEWETIIEHRQ